MAKRHWNHRIITRLNHYELAGELYTDRLFDIAEVHYKGKKVESYGDIHLLKNLEDVAALKWTHEQIASAFDKPVLDVDNWPHEYIDYESWVGKEVIKKSGKPFKSSKKIGKVEELAVNLNSSKQAFIMDDDSIVDCYICKLND